MATDLRFITLALKMVTDLERMADHCTNLAEQVIFLVRGEDVRHLGKLGKQ
jgi:phosphate uptake regulator